MPIAKNKPETVNEKLYMVSTHIVIFCLEILISPPIPKMSTVKLYLLI